MVEKTYRSRLNRAGLLAAALSTLLIWGCGTAGKTVKIQPAAASLAETSHTEKLNEALQEGALQEPTLEEDYQVGPGDLLEIEAYKVDEVNRTVRVNSRGEIALPLVGVLNVKGLTTSEIEDLIAKKLEKYVQTPVVTVYVKEYKSQQISVMGEVKSPNIYAVTGQRYLLQMLMMAGGLTPDAGNVCYIIRPLFKTDRKKRSQTIVINLNDLLVKGDSSLDVPVFAGDVINVPRGSIFFVDGEVKSPGAFVMTGRTTLMEAMSMAHGANSSASLSDIRIYRDNGKGGRDIKTVDYKAILKGDKPDVEIADNDIIIVPENGVKHFFKNFFSTVGRFVTFGALTL